MSDSTPVFNMAGSGSTSLGTGPHECALCHRRFPIKKTLTRHQNAVHRDMVSKCIQCGRTFARKDVLDRHIESQHSAYSQIVTCDRCGKDVRRRSLTAHQASDSCKRAFAARIAKRCIAGPQAWTSTLLCNPPKTSIVQRRTNTETYSPFTEGASGNMPQLLWDMSDQAIEAALEDTAVHHLQTRSAAASPHRGLTLEEIDAMSPEEVIVQCILSTQIGMAYFSQDRRSQHLPTPNYLPAIADPVLLGAWMFVKLKPWGPKHCWADDGWLVGPPRTYSNPPEGIFKLRAVVYRSILNALANDSITRDPYFPDALIMLILFTCQTDGWEVALTHCQPLVWLACSQLQSGSGSREAYQTTIAVDAFRTVLSQHVRSEYVTPLERVFTMAQRIMRKAVVDIIDTPPEDTSVPVWHRSLSLKASLWYQSYKEPLLFIRDIAESIPYNIERQPSGVVDEG